MSGLPRYVTDLDEAPTPIGDLDPVRIERLIDAFRIVDSGNHAEMAVVVDLVGKLHVVVDPLASLPGPLREAWHRIELARPLPVVTLRSFWLLDASGVEQSDDTPGEDDPVVLIGELIGPFGPEAAAPTRRKARLVVTRKELLRGLVRGSDRPVVSVADGKLAPAWVPGDRDDVVAGGHGAVLAWLLPPQELRADGVANEALVDAVIHDLLGAMKADLQKMKADDPLVKLVLPVPSRDEVVRRLVSEGWKVSGNLAQRERTTTPFSGFLEMVFGPPSGAQMTLPPEARPGQLLDLARAQLGRWPKNGREQALEARLLGQSSPTIPRASAPDYRPPSALAGQPLPPPKPAPRRAEPQDWEADFRSLPPTPRRTTTTAPSGSPTPTIVPPRRTAPHPPTGAAKKASPPAPPTKGPRKSWDDDFK